MDTDREIRVQGISSREAGGCNGCTQHNTAAGITEHDVLLIQVGGVELRVCSMCLTRLLCAIDDGIASLDRRRN